LLTDGVSSLGLTEQYCAGETLVGLAGKDRELLLAYAHDIRLERARNPIFIALARRRERPP
jgi:hypothetical protein